MDNLTIITCLYDIRKKEGSTPQSIHTINDYLELSKHMLQVHLPMVIFTDEENITRHISKVRTGYGLLDKTVIINLPFEETFFYKDLNVLKERMNQYSIVNWNKEKDTPLYVLLNNNKFDFLQRAMQLNPFHTNFFLWMDMGIQHCTKATKDEWMEVSKSWPSFICQYRDRIHKLRIHTTTKPENMTWKDYFKMIYHHVAGGLFGGHKDCLYEYIQLFKQQWETILYKEKWWQLDEAVMTILTDTYPDKFRFFYGDYDGLISNFIKSKKSFHLVFQTAQRHLDSKKYHLVTHVLDTIDMNDLVGTEYQERYFNMMVCNDFYHWNGKMSDVLQDILMEKSHRLPIPIVQSQMINIQYFTDPKIVSFFAEWVFKDPCNQMVLQKWKERGAGCWFYLDPLSKKVLAQNDFVVMDLFLDQDHNPRHILRLFQSQFSFLSEKIVSFFYNFLENKNGETVYFLYNAPCSLEEEQHDQDLLKLCYFLKRNFPHLKFYMVCLYMNRPFLIQTETPPHELLVFCMKTPYFLKDNADSPYYQRLIHEWFQLLIR